MKRMQGFLIAVVACALALCARAEAMPEAAQALVPAQATITDDQTVGGLRVLTMELPSGEALDLAWDLHADAPVLLTTRTPAPAGSDVQSREEAERLALEAYPDARVLFTQDSPEGGKTLQLLSESICGTVTVQGGVVVARALGFGHYFSDGRLTMEGALKTMTLYRPDAEFHALELDEDDGMLLYEGDAWLNGVEYEFELDARTCRLLKWERD